MFTEIIILIPIMLAASLSIFGIFYLLIIKAMKFIIHKLFNIDKNSLNKIFLIIFISISILFAIFYNIMLVYDIILNGIELHTFIDKDNHVYLSNLIFAVFLILESIIISYISISKNKKLFRNSF